MCVQVWVFETDLVICHSLWKAVPVYQKAIKGFECKSVFGAVHMQSFGYQTGKHKHGCFPVSWRSVRSLPACLTKICCHSCNTDWFQNQKKVLIFCNLNFWALTAMFFYCEIIRNSINFHGFHMNMLQCWPMQSNRSKSTSFPWTISARISSMNLNKLQPKFAA